MAESHPSDVELLEYAEGELDPGAAERVRAHVASCSACARELEEAGRARTLLRAAPLLDLPESRGAALVRDLPAQERERPRALALVSSPRRLIAVLAPVAIAIVVVVAVTSGGKSKPAEHGAAPEAAVATTAAALDQAAGAAAGAATSATAKSAEAPLLTVAGPASSVARILRAEGLEARVVHGAVRVRGASRAAVRKALAGRPPGPVRVILDSR